MMKPLLEITTTPARYEYEVKRPRLEISQNKAKVDRTTKRASLNLKTEAGRLEMNTVRRRSDMGFKGVVDRANFESERGRKAAMEATANYAEMGNQMLNIQRGANIPDALWSKTVKYSKGDLVLVPLSPIELRYIPTNLDVEYMPSELKANWDVGKAQLDFVPGHFGINITEFSSIEFRYMGTPVYAPPSADPHFIVDA